MAISEAKKKSDKKYVAKTYSTITCKSKKAIIEKCRTYADLKGLSHSKFAELAMLYCIDNNIDLKPKDE
jgi:hypothetical protein